MIFSRRVFLQCFLKVLLALFLLSGSLNALAVPSGAITFVEMQKQGVAGVDGLNGVSDVAVSADGKFVYTAAYASGAVAIFQRDAITGQLTYISSVTSSSINTLVAAFSIVASRDNKSIYVASPTSSSINAFSRDEVTGELTFVNSQTVGQNGMSVGGFVSVSISPDGKSVYGIGGSGTHGLAVFSRDTSTGAITFVQEQLDNVNGNYLGQGFSPTASPIKNITVTSSGLYLYVTSTTDNAVSLFNRDLTTGLLTLSAVYIDNTNGVDGIQGASSLTLSPDEKNLYVSGQGEGSVGIFSVNQNTGALTYVNKITQGVAGVTSLAGARSLAVSPDGKYVYSSAITSNAITAFDRDSLTGLLTVNTVAVDGTGGIDGISAASGMATDPLNRHLYVAGQGDEALAVFSLPIPAVILSTSQQTTTVNGSAITVDSQLEVYDSDSVNLVSATVTISEGFLATDLLAVTPQAGITSSYNANTGVLTLTGVASLADYKATLRSLTYTAGADQSLSVGQSSLRKINILVSDGDNASAPASSIVTVQKILTVAVTFVDWDGSVLSTQQVASGAAATAPAQPTRAGYVFTGWDVAFTNITTTTTVMAQYATSDYTVTFDLAGGVATGGGALVQTIISGQAAVAPEFTPPTGRSFTGWSASFNNITATTTITAQYAYINYTVTAVVNGSGSVSPATQQVPFGSQAIFTLSLVNANDAAVLSSNCNAFLSGNQLMTADITANCSITVSVYPALAITKDSNSPVTVNTAGRFTIAGGGGDKTLSEATVIRAGEEELLSQAAGRALVTVQDDGSYLFSASRTGRYLLNFDDSASGEVATISFDVLPYIAFTSSKQTVQQETAAVLRVWLSDEPIEYPVRVSFVATGASVSAEQFEITAADNLRHSYNVTATAATASVQLVEANLVNALIGTPALHTFVVQQSASRLSLNVTASQNGQQGNVITSTDGDVTLSVAELNNTTATYIWSADGLLLTTNGATATFNPAAGVEGRHNVSVTATTTDGRTGQYDLSLRIVGTCPIGDCASTGVSGIPTSANLVAQTPNRLPICPNVNANSRAVSCQAAGASTLYAEVPNQFSLTMGSVASDQSWASGQFGMAVNQQTFTDSGFTQLGVVVNFDVVGLESPGEAVPVAIPLPANISIPQNAVWRKLINNQWQDFVVDDVNSIHSAARDALGQCSGVSSSVWSEGLTEGHGCVRLTINDGGPNDDDGLINGVIRDPGVLAVAQPVVPPVVTPPSTPLVKTITVKSNGGGSMDGLGLLLLGFLAMLRTRKVTAAALVALLPASVMAEGVYVGVDGVAVETKTSNANVTRKLYEDGLTGSAEVDNGSRGGWNIYAGYQLDDAISVELGWLDAGKVTTRFNGVPDATTDEQLSAVAPHSGEGVSLSLRWHVTDKFAHVKPSLRAGVWQMEFKDHYLNGVNATTIKEKDTVPFIGLDAEIPVTQQWSAKLGASSYFAENYSITMVNLGLMYHF